MISNVSFSGIHHIQIPTGSTAALVTEEITVRERKSVIAEKTGPNTMRLTVWNADDFIRKNYKPVS